MPMDEDSLKRIVACGAKAPSGDNCQPWAFKWDGKRLFIIKDAARDTSLYNTNDTASLIANGALLENIRIAAAEKGYSLDTELFPKGANDPLLAVVSFIEGQSDPDGLFAFIEKRCTNRWPYRKEPLKSLDKDAILAASEKAGPGKLFLVEEQVDKEIAASAASLNDRLLFENRRLHDFLFEHIRWNKNEAESTGDGLDIRTLGLNSIESLSFKMLGNWGAVRFLNLFGLSRTLPKKTYRICANSSAMGLIQMEGLSPKDFLLGGMLLQRIWLTTASLGLAFQPMTGVTFLIQRLFLEDGEGISPCQKKALEAAEAELKRVFPIDRKKAMIMLFRVGYADPPSVMSLRREVLIAPE